MFTVYYHPACYTSYSLLKALSNNDMIKSIRTVDMSVNYYLAISRQILTVPLIENNGEQIYGGPIDIQKALILISNGTVSLNVENVREALLLAISDSAAISSILYSYGSVKPLRLMKCKKKRLKKFIKLLTKTANFMTKSKEK